jgi:hypothetical protein
MATAEYYKAFGRGRKVGCEFAESRMKAASQQSLRLDLTPADTAAFLASSMGWGERRADENSLGGGW